MQLLNISPAAKYLLTWDINVLRDGGIWKAGKNSAFQDNRVGCLLLSDTNPYRGVMRNCGSLAKVQG